ncbi:MAG: hypothetical protein WCK82_05255 [Bacteroidota bacterium]|jgi:hypothetical protein
MNKIPTGHFLDGYTDIAENQEIVLNTERLDRNSVCVNLDVYDHEEDQVVKGNGYVQVRQDDQDKCFYVTVFNFDGDVLSETEVPFNFKEF